MKLPGIIKLTNRKRSYIHYELSFNFFILTKKVLFMFCMLDILYYMVIVRNDIVP